ncbi:MAG: hypothetical protein HYX94_01290 [Chloroflexi bacterium]|nr:hypothetical protein [Chloroflexota bacterium]
MNDESIPAICRECPQSRENFYTKSWYCVNSGAPLGSKRAWDYCTSPRRAEALARSDGSATGQASSPAASPATGSPTGQADRSEASSTAESAPDASEEAPGADFSPQHREAADGDAAPDEQTENAPPEDLLYGYSFDCL